MRMRRLATVAILWLAAAGVGPVLAQPAAVPVEVAAEIQRTLATGRAQIAADDAFYAGLNNPPLAATKRAQARARAEGDLIAVTLAAMARYPAHARGIADHAAASAPEFAPALRGAVAASYPGVAAPAAAPTQPANWYSQSVLERRGLATGPAVAAAPAPQPRVAAAGGVQPADWYDQPALRRYGGGPPPAFPQPPLPAGVAPTAEKGPAPTAAAAGRGPDEIWDPLEPLNRAFFAFNEVTDTFILRPIAWTYSFAPDEVKRAVRNALGNLDSPVIFANDVLQGTFEDAGITLGRFLVNSTVGVLGLFDVADAWFELPGHHADFGQTLHSYGAGPGPYLVLPLIGPSNARDGIGKAADTAMDPMTWLANRYWNAGRTGANAIATRERLLKPLDELRRSSVDYYAALRGAYYQRRQIELGKGRSDGPAAAKAADEAFEQME